MNTIKVIKATAFATYKEWTAYRSHAMISLFTAPCYFLVQSFIWKAVLADTGSIQGSSLSEMLSYYGVMVLLGIVVFDSADWNLGMLVRTGKFITFMLRPMSHRVYAFSQKLGHRTFGMVVEFIPLFFLFMVVFKVPMKPVYPVWFGISVVMSFVLVFLLNYCLGLCAFWVTRTDGLRRFVMFITYLCSGGFIPLFLYPDVFQKILFFLPFQYTTYVPMRVFLGSYSVAGKTISVQTMVGLQFVMVILVFCLSEFLWRISIKRFTGVGV